MEITYYNKETHRAKRLLSLASLLHETREELFEEILRLHDHKGMLSIYVKEQTNVIVQRQILETCRDIWAIFNEFEVEIVITKDYERKQYRIENIKGFEEFRIAVNKSKEIF
jgi:hypothetical protein